MKRMNRLKLLAAEVFSYSYADYADHLGNARFDSIMPRWVATLERAVKEQWPIQEIAKSLEVEPGEAEDLLAAYHRAVQIIEAANPAEAFRTGVRQSIEFALEERLEGSEAVEKLVTQVCYRAADLAYILDLEGSRLSRYSRHLRREPDVEYYEGYFDESDED
jgi:hypothetical protein